MNCEKRTSNVKFRRRPIGSQLAREPPSDIFHGHTPAHRKLGVTDFFSPEAQTETDEERIEIATKGKTPDFAKSLNGWQIKDLISYICDLAEKK
jgi:hypothetical protein